MWTIKQKILNEQKIYHVQIEENGRVLTFKEVIHYWQENEAFRAFYTNTLNESGFAAYFWEHPPITTATINRAYEFVLVKSNSLDGIQANGRPFQQKLASSNPNKTVVTFENLRKDAMMVLPKRINPSTDCAHLGAFLQTTAQEQLHELWQVTGKAIKERLSNDLMWISTHGLGVIWLHIRLDSYPKYYHYDRYRNERVI